MTTEGKITARLVRFRNGAVLEHERAGSHSQGHGMMRIEGRMLGVQVIAQELAHMVLELGPGASLLP